VYLLKLADEILLITAGTGTFGNAVLRRKDAQLVIAGPDDAELAEVQTLVRQLGLQQQVFFWGCYLILTFCPLFRFGALDDRLEAVCQRVITERAEKQAENPT